MLAHVPQSEMVLPCTPEQGARLGISVHEILSTLRRGAIVLDLGSGPGSFALGDNSIRAVRIDRELERLSGPLAVQANAAQLPFAADVFDAIVSNHSLEHFDDLSGALQEVARVLKSGGGLYIGVPDASTMSDRLYRWLARGGGHVNPFTSARDLAARIEKMGIPHVATRTLCTSFAYLNRHNPGSRGSRRIWLLGGGTELSLLAITYIASLADRFLKTRLRVYGWAFYFGNIEGPVDCRTWTNVCIRCGAGYSSDWLRFERGLVRRYGIFPLYQCPQCGTNNLFTDDAHYTYPN